MYELVFLQTHPGALAAVAGVFGLLVGSFINVVIHRLPRMMEREWREQAAKLAEESGSADCAAALRGTPATTRYNLIVPGSHCPKCGYRIRAWQNVPVISYLWLRGKCAGCGTAISARYPIVEAISGITAGYLAWRYGFSLAALGAALFAWSLIALTVIDIDTQFLPDDITLPLLWTGLLFNLGATFAPLFEAVIGAAAGYLSLWSVYWLFKMATGKEGMGFGDFKLLGAIGAWLGWKMLPLVILLSSFVGAAVGIALIALKRHKRGTPIPFGPYLAAAGLIALLWGEYLNRTYLQLFR
ncbi:MAG TPA: A24 family peptidase [Burkholderiales bacterium]|jgi:leader peptidase (prepilin peptidase)/N-methyltransferase|nr:A24 family peptidase [Burkholderiales bacterium]